jgi:hypothetical protein
MEGTNRVAISNREAIISNLMVVTSNREVIISNSSSMDTSKEVMVKIPVTEALPKPSNISSSLKVNISRDHPKEDTELLHRSPRKHPSGKPQQHPMAKPTIITKCRGRQRGKNLRGCRRV